MAQFVTFYSFKGGVGRSLALSNVAWALSQQGRRVVILDMDLEAPDDHAPFALTAPARPGGLVDWVWRYHETGEAPENITPWMCRSSAAPSELHVLRAGRELEGYAQRLSALDWLSLHPTRGTQPLLDALRASIERELKPHYVLIDSRTGFSDVGGVSTHLLADFVVLVSNLSLPCLDGTVRAYRSIWEAGREEVPGGPALVISPVPPGGLRHPTVVERMKQAKQAMPRAWGEGRQALSIVYDADMALAEELAMQTVEGGFGVFPATTHYAQLTQWVRKANTRDIYRYIEEAEGAAERGRVDEGIAVLERFAKAHSDDSEGWRELGWFAGLHSKTEQALAALERAVEVNDSDGEAWRLLGLWLGQKGPAQEQFLKSVEAYDTAERLVPLSSVDKYNRARALLQIGQSCEGPDREYHLDRAISDFWVALGGLRVVEDQPAWEWAHGGLGHALRLRADGVSAAGRAALRQVAMHYSELTTEKFHEGVCTRESVGDSLYMLAGLQDDRERMSTLEFCLQTLEQAEASAPISQVQAKRLVVHADITKMSSDEVRLMWAERLLGLLGSVLSASDVAPWLLQRIAGLVVGWQTTLPDIFPNALQQALDLCHRANALTPRIANYNLACALTHLKRYDEARAALIELLEAGDALPPHALSDPDLTPLWLHDPDLKSKIEAALTSPPASSPA